MYYGPEIIRRAYRYRILPTPSQIEGFMQISGCGRLVYNEALERERKARSGGGKIGYADHQKNLTIMKKVRPFLRDVPHHTLQAALRDLEQANERWRTGQNEEPAFRRHGEAPSFRFPDPAQFRIERIPNADRRSGVSRARGAAAGKARYLRAPKFGMRPGDRGAIEVIVHRPLKGRVKTCTISREGDHWYASFSVEIRRRDRASLPRNPGTERLFATDPTLGEQPSKPGRKATRAHRADHRRLAAERRAKRNRSREAQREIVTTRAAECSPLTPEEHTLLGTLCVVGGDLGVANPITLSTGEMLGGTVLTRDEERHLARLQRIVARKEAALSARHGRAPGASLKGLQPPKALGKARARVRRFWGKILRRRRDMIHKITTWIVAHHDVVVLEDLDTQNMTASAKGTMDAPGRNVAQKAGLNRAILDRCWGEFVRQLSYKLAHASRRRGLKKILLRVSPAYTSQTCHRCKSINSENRPSQSVFACTACGHKDHADVNAARNIRELGMAEIARACGMTLEDLPEVLVTPSECAAGRPCNQDDTAGGSPVAASGGIGHRAPGTPLAGKEEVCAFGAFPGTSGGQGSSAASAD